MTLIIIGVIVLALVLWFFGAYNGLIRLRNTVQEAWAQIDVELKRRHDLIGNLVETVKGYAQHERGTLEAVTQARAAAMAPGQSPADASRSEAALSQALVRLNAVAEAYPDLKANANFTALQQELSSTEDRIASARRYYNATVKELNTKVESIPTNFIAGPAGVSKAEYFELEAPAEREAPKVSFDPNPPAVGQAGPYAGQQLPPAAPGAGAPVQDSPWQQPPTQ
ncbi:MAG: LemA family protein [Actinomycetales bacterium]|nr:LemA family protein [Actinomycetales bacterium]